MIEGILLFLSLNCGSVSLCFCCHHCLNVRQHEEGKKWEDKLTLIPFSAVKEAKRCHKTALICCQRAQKGVKMPIFMLVLIRLMVWHGSPFFAIRLGPVIFYGLTYQLIQVRCEYPIKKLMYTAIKISDYYVCVNSHIMQHIYLACSNINIHYIINLA